MARPPVDEAPDPRVLPPGQRRRDGFPRFGPLLTKRAPTVPSLPALTIRGLIPAFELPLTALATLPRRELLADFHCVTGWSTTDLRWEGVRFETLYRAVLEPRISLGARCTHVAFRGLDGFESVLALADALAADVLLADRLDGRPLSGDHGAPLRLVSPQQYGYMSTKHLCRIELHASEPKRRPTFGRALLRLLGRHPSAHVWAEERHSDLPAWAIRGVYRALIAPTVYLNARGRRDGG